MAAIITIESLDKVYQGGFRALDDINLTIERGEIFALLGPNGAGKTTLISTICGIVMPSAGTIHADGHDVVRDYRAARQAIGLVPQELSTDSFETVWDTVRFSRGLFGKPRNDELIAGLLRDLSLWDKKDARIMTLSGGMKRRVMIAKALSHEPDILFLDEPTAGVDVELRRDMWEMVRRLRDRGVTVILTTHYIEEAEEMADRIGVINKGRIIMVENKTTLMRRLGQRRLTLTLQAPLDSIPGELAGQNLTLSEDGMQLTFVFQGDDGNAGIASLLRQLQQLGIDYQDLHTRESSLEEIFVQLVHSGTPAGEQP